MREQMIRRREFITLLGSAAAAWPVAARAQQGVPVVGYLSNSSQSATEMEAFRQGLGDTGHVEGHNLAIEFRWAEGRYERFPGLIADLVRLKVLVLCTFGGATTRAAMGAAPPMPIVFVAGADPVAFGLNVNLNRAGGGLTGVTTVNTELLPKRMELLHELAPAARTVALLVNPQSGTPRPKRRPPKRRPAASGLNSKSCKPAPKARSMPPSLA